MSIEKIIHKIENHIVILGYNSRVERIVEEMSGEGQRGEEVPILIISDIPEPPVAKKMGAVAALCKSRSIPEPQIFLPEGLPSL